MKNNYAPGDIVLVKFPFSDLNSSKKRPALVLNQSRITDKVNLVTIAMITSKIEGIKISGDFKILHWKESGLLHPSLVRLSKLTTLEGDLVEKIMGKLLPVDLKGAKKSFQKQFDFWV